jgi:hypothetical protein
MIETLSSFWWKCFLFHVSCLIKNFLDFMLKKLLVNQHGFFFFFLDFMLKKTFSEPTWIFFWLKKNFLVTNMDFYFSFWTPC